MPLGTQKTALEINLEQLLFYIAETEGVHYDFCHFLLNLFRTESHFCFILLLVSFEVGEHFGEQHYSKEIKIIFNSIFLTPVRHSYYWILKIWNFSTSFST